ncbi:hypothetical protein MVEN_00652700 [Mycena venus]|uniref:Uncharacterized protein n=1 Tax=Mycena venus TaxID=2733690 RepID=A0A8H7D6A7_9AGAR|nr:hypothetical protein MVEN_00652700 [Mycena venus]
MEPTLPTDLERLVFETAAIARPTSIPDLMLVASRVKVWIEPLLYRVIFLSNSVREDLGRPFHIPIFTVDSLSLLVRTRPRTCFRRVEHVHIGSSVNLSTVESLFAVCGGITNIFAHFSGQDPDSALIALSALHNVQYLAIAGITIFFYPSPKTPHSLFLTVTHLELFQMQDISSKDKESICAKLTLIPQLTHVALNLQFDDSRWHAALCTDTRLQCIVFLSSWSYTVDEGSVIPLREDERFVCIEQQLDYREDWLRGAVTGQDYWALADDFIAARRKGKVPRMYPIFPVERQSGYLFNLDRNMV